MWRVHAKNFRFWFFFIVCEKVLKTKKKKKKKKIKAELQGLVYVGRITDYMSKLSDSDNIFYIEVNGAFGIHIAHNSELAKKKLISASHYVYVYFMRE